MKYQYTVYKIEQNGKLSNKEHLNDNELDKWMDKVYGKFVNIKVERNDGHTIEYTDNGKKFVVKKKSKGIKEKTKLDELVTKYLNEASAGQAQERGKELHDLLMNSDNLDNLKNAHMKTQKEAAKVFQQAINILKGLKS